MCHSQIIFLEIKNNSNSYFKYICLALISRTGLSFWGKIKF